ncbi:hypothetical protein NHX12_003001 [Muraenolepis orangiensis]|uniref:Uncharacterized protein n=1 Tax=Muraenolepis orangiensis TaxID=630683 RepID=A0A9Q0DZI5_9TELE|nr:hypothetical protein NHX12_003001 [Muraenolepis orangiensis]
MVTLPSTSLHLHGADRPCSSPPHYGFSDMVSPVLPGGVGALQRISAGLTMRGFHCLALPSTTEPYT